MSVARRIASALAANAFGQGVTVAAQLLLTPLFFKVWGAATYGEWLLLSSIPAYLTMADLGIGSAAGNDMTMKAGAGDRVGAQRTFRGALWVALAAGGLALGAGLAAAGASLRWGIPATPHVAPDAAATVLLLLAVTVALGFVGGVVSAGFRCAGRNALGIVLANTARLMEVLLTAGLLLIDSTPLALAQGLVGVKALMLLLQFAWLRLVCPWLHTPAAPPERGLVRRLIAPSLGFMAFPMGNALALQGPILILGSLMGGPAVAMFSAMRTLARLPIQITNVFNASVWPEMSLAYGAQDLPLLRTLHRRSWGMTLLLIALAALGLLALGPWLAGRWLGPAAPFEAPLLQALIAITVASAIWNASSVVLAAVNAHARLGLQYVVLNGVFMGLAAVCAPRWGWTGLLTPLVLAELALLCLILPQALRVTHDTLPAFLQGATLGALSASRSGLAALWLRRRRP